MIELSATKIFRFEAAHMLPHHDGKCKKLHGHNYKLEVTVSGSRITVGPESGMVVDFSNIKKIINHYLDNWDHSYLNDFMQNPTAENMVVLFLEYCKAQSLGVSKIKLWETDDSFVEWEKQRKIGDPNIPFVFKECSGCKAKPVDTELCPECVERRNK